MKHEVDSDFLARIELLIGQACISEAQSMLLYMNLGSIPRAQTYRVCQLSRRAGLTLLSLKILNPIVRAKAPVHPLSTASEVAEYAASLSNIGAADEALSILKQLDWRQYHQSLLYRALVHISQWNYLAAIPSLKRYILVDSLTSYQRTVGKINLSAALIAESQFSGAWQLLLQIEQELDPKINILLFANFLELSAQVLILTKKFDQARIYLQRGFALLGSSQQLSLLFLQKWLCIMELIEKGPTPEILMQIAEVKKAAMLLKHWETLRHLDLYLAVTSNNDTLFRQVYHGTVFAKYRKKMKQMYKFNFKAEGMIRWSPPGLSLSTLEVDQQEQKQMMSVDIRTGKVFSSTAHLKIGQTQHRALVALCADFYRPQRMGELHARIFPKEYFNPFSSPARLNKTIGRLRQWLKSVDLPLSIHVDNGTYRLSSNGSVSLVIRDGQKETKSSDILLSALKTQFPYQHFTTGSAALALNIPKRSISRILQHGLTLGKLLRFGKGRSVSYRFRS